MEPNDLTATFFPFASMSRMPQLPLQNVNGFHGVSGFPLPSGQLPVSGFAPSSYLHHPAYPFKRYNPEWYNGLVASQTVEHQQHSFQHGQLTSEAAPSANQATSGAFLSSILQTSPSSGCDPESISSDPLLQSSPVAGSEPSQSCNEPCVTAKPAATGVLQPTGSPAFGQSASVATQTEPGRLVPRSVPQNTPASRAFDLRFLPPPASLRAHPNLFSSKLESPSAFEAWSNPALRLPGSSSNDIQRNIFSPLTSSRIQVPSTGPLSKFGNDLGSQRDPVVENKQPAPALTPDRATSGTFTGLQDLCSDFCKPERAASVNDTSEARHHLQASENLGPSLSRHQLKSSPKSNAKHRSVKLLNPEERSDDDECPGDEVSSPLQRSPTAAKQWQTPPQVRRKVKDGVKQEEQTPLCVPSTQSPGRGSGVSLKSNGDLSKRNGGANGSMKDRQPGLPAHGKADGMNGVHVLKSHSCGSLATSCSGMPGLERLDWLASVATECRSPPSRAAEKILRKPRTPVPFRMSKGASVSGSQPLNSIPEEVPEQANGEQEATSPHRKALPLKKRPREERSPNLAGALFSPRKVKRHLSESGKKPSDGKEKLQKQESPRTGSEKKRKFDAGTSEQNKSLRELPRSPQGRFISKQEAVESQERTAEGESELEKIKRAAELALRVRPQPKRPRLEVGVEEKNSKPKTKEQKSRKEVQVKKKPSEPEVGKVNKRSGNSVEAPQKGKKVRVLSQGKAGNDEKKRSHKKKATGGGTAGKPGEEKKKVKGQKEDDKKKGMKKAAGKKGDKTKDKKKVDKSKTSGRASKSSASGGTAQSSPAPPRSATLAACLADTRKRPSGEKETRIQRFARYILNYIGRELTPESVIRKEMGNTPDTSKALRLLVSEKKVNRRGTGGRPDPFIYKITKKGLTHLEDVHAAYGSMPTHTYNPAAAVDLTDS